MDGREVKSGIVCILFLSQCSRVLDHWNALLFYFKSECKVSDVNKDEKQSQKRKAENLPQLAKKQKVDLKSSFVQVRDPSSKSKLDKPESCAQINNSEIMQVTVPAPNISNKKEKLEKQKSGSQNSLPPKKVKCI